MEKRKATLMLSAGMILCSLLVFGQGVAAPFPSDSLIRIRRTPSPCYTLVCRTNGQGAQAVELVCDTLYGSPEDPSAIGCVTLGPDGQQQFTVLSMSAAAEKYGAHPFVPTKAPAWVLGSADYYAWRNENFLLRCKLCGRSAAAPDYYLDYGNKYALRFPQDVRPKLTPDGQAWLDKTLLLLQIATEDILARDGDAELDNRAFRRQLFGLHAEVYEVSGFFELTLRDKWIVFRALDLRDIVSREGREQLKIIGKAYARYAVTKRWAH